MGLKLKPCQDSRVADHASAALAAQPVGIEILPGVGMRVPTPRGKEKWYACLPEPSAGWACRLIPEDAGDAHEGYVVERGKDGWRCTCDAWKFSPGGAPCKHILACLPIAEALAAWVPAVPAQEPPKPVPVPAGAGLLAAYAAKTGQDVADIRRRQRDSQHQERERQRMACLAGSRADEGGPAPLPVEVRQALADLREDILGAVAQIVKTAKEQR